MLCLSPPDRGHAQSDYERCAGAGKGDRHLSPDHATRGARCFAQKVPVPFSPLDMPQKPAIISHFGAFSAGKLRCRMGAALASRESADAHSQGRDYGRGPEPGPLAAAAVRGLGRRGEDGPADHPRGSGRGGGRGGLRRGPPRQPAGLPRGGRRVRPHAGVRRAARAAGLRRGALSGGRSSSAISRSCTW